MSGSIGKVSDRNYIRSGNHMKSDQQSVMRICGEHNEYNRNPYRNDVIKVISHTSEPIFARNASNIKNHDLIYRLIVGGNIVLSTGTMSARYRLLMRYIPADLCIFKSSDYSLIVH